jgi:hypothetical protein
VAAHIDSAGVQRTIAELAGRLCAERSAGGSLACSTADPVGNER